MTAFSGKAAFELLKLKAAKLKEQNEQLDRQNKELEKEIQQLKNKDAQAQAKNISMNEVASFHVYCEKFSEPLDAAAMRFSADAIRKEDPEAIIFLTNSQGLYVASSGGAAQQAGIGANQIVKLTEAVGGSGGGRPDMAQGRFKEPERFLEFLDMIMKFINEKAKD